MPATADPPVVPAAPAAPAAAPAPAAPKPSSGPDQVPASSIAPPIEMPANIRKGSAKERLFQDLAKAGKPAPAEPPATPAQPSPATEPPKAGQETPKDGATPPAEPASTPPAEPPKTGKVSPWKLVDEHKAARAAAEAKLAELQKLVPDPAALEKQRTDFEATQKRAQELEKLIAFLDYQQSSDFKEKYQKPYEQAWEQAAAELSELYYTDPETKQSRPAKAEDLQALLQMSAGDARPLAEAFFGPFANDIMNMRSKIKDLFNAQNRALADARKNADTWKTNQLQATKAAQEQIQSQITNLWKEANTAITKDPVHGKWLTPVDGNTEVNTRLEKGFKFVEEAWSSDPLNPQLTPEQRAKAVKMHSALRNRAAAYGRLVYEINQLNSKVAELTKQIDGYKASTPPIAPSAPGQTPATEARGIARLHAELVKIAK